MKKDKKWLKEKYVEVFDRRGAGNQVVISMAERIKIVM